MVASGEATTEASIKAMDKECHHRIADYAMDPASISLAIAKVAQDPDQSWCQALHKAATVAMVRGNYSPISATSVEAVDIYSDNNPISVTHNHAKLTADNVMGEDEGSQVTALDVPEEGS